MKTTDHNLSSGGSAAACRAKQAVRDGGDDVHLSELVRSLRSLASDSPERQAKLEELARIYAAGTYTVDVAATAGKMIEDAIEK
jgi:anti-sigma28 factor (negative regulator of flagellin synthesis)